MAERKTEQFILDALGTPDAHDPLAGAMAGLPASFERALRAQNRARGTISSYMESIRFFYAYLQEQGMPLALEAIHREHVESWIISLQTEPNARTGRPLAAASVNNRYKAVHVYFTWALEEDEIRAHPMAKMKRPAIPEDPPPVLEPDQIDRLLKVCAGRDFYSRRDLAIIRLFLDTGLRVSELVGLKGTDIDWQRDTVTVMGKGRRQRAVPFGRKAGQAIDRYIRMRSSYTTASLPNLWLGHSGKPLTRSGVLQIVRERGEKAGIAALHPHLFRHGLAHQWLSEGGTEGGLMRIMDWKSRTMLTRYGASAATRRAHEEHRRLQPGDKF